MQELYYSDYLQLNQILSAQAPLSTARGSSVVRHESFFIILHQTYELWFKQMIHELDFMLQKFSQPSLADSEISEVVSALRRMIEIQTLLVAQVDVLKTLTPMDFLEFRDLIAPASGFQSFQFRLLENKLGLRERLELSGTKYLSRFQPEHRKILEESEKATSLVESVDQWLSRTPFLKTSDFRFWETYRRAVEDVLKQEEEVIRKQSAHSQEALGTELKRLEQTRNHFSVFLDQKKYEELRKEGKRRLRFESMGAALLIYLYREQPALQLPFQFLSSLVELDELLSQWRYRHAMMAQRMLGSKVGTGGSSGYDYLKTTADQHKLFIDLVGLSTLLIPRSKIPVLPANLIERLGLVYGG